MKLRFLVAALSLLTINSSFACYSDRDLTVCPGDTAVVNNYLTKIVGVNPRTQQVSARYASGTITTANIANITLGKGCAGSACVGNRAVANNYLTTIVGVNKLTNKVSAQYASGTITTLTADQVGIGQGCLKGYCVGDKAVANNYLTRIVGINRIQKTISAQYASGTITTLPVVNASIGKGCIDGVCVGDQAVVNNYNVRIVGVNPFYKKVSAQYASGTITTVDINNVFVSNYCLDYDSNSRVRNISNPIDFEIRFNISIKIK